MLILNDVDRGEAQLHRELLNSLELKYSGEEDKAVLTFLTVNDINRLDPALLRPGRVHEIIHIPEPSKKTVKVILNYYLDKFTIEMGKKQKNRFLKESAGFSPADIREFCETSRAIGVNLALDEVKRIREQRSYYAGGKCASFNSRNKAPEAC